MNICIFLRLCYVPLFHRRIPRYGAEKTNAVGTTGDHLVGMGPGDQFPSGVSTISSVSIINGIINGIMMVYLIMKIIVIIYF